MLTPSSLSNSDVSDSISVFEFSDFQFGFQKLVEPIASVDQSCAISCFLHFTSIGFDCAFVKLVSLFTFCSI